MECAEKGWIPSNQIMWPVGVGTRQLCFIVLTAAGTSQLLMVLLINKNMNMSWKLCSICCP
jgi:hypothetical protein